VLTIKTSRRVLTPAGFLSFPRDTNAMDVLRVCALASVVLAVGCGSSNSPSPTAPSPPLTSSVTGSWSGSYVAICPNSPNCASIAGAPAGPQAFALALRQDGNRISGQINLTGWIARVASVTGTIASDGVMTLQGTDSWPALEFCQPAGEWSITGWNARYDALTDTIAGDFSFVTQKRLSSCYYTQDLRANATSMSLRHGAPPPATLAGHWQGTYAILQCTPGGWSSCTPRPNPGYFVPLDLQLSQDGSVVSGAITTIPFSNVTPLPTEGSVGTNVSTLNLRATRSEAVSGGTHVVRLTSWDTTIDAVGRLQGTFSYVDEVRWTEGPSAGTTWATSYDAELRHVVRVPW
jgi:hypothetical protein